MRMQGFTPDLELISTWNAYKRKQSNQRSLLHQICMRMRSDHRKMQQPACLHGCLAAWPARCLAAWADCLGVCLAARWAGWLARCLPGCVAACRLTGWFFLFSPSAGGGGEKLTKKEKLTQIMKITENLNYNEKQCFLQKSLVFHCNYKVFRDFHDLG